MRYLAFFLLSASLFGAERFATGQAARLVIGQRTFTAQESGTSERILGAVGGLAYANDMLIVADSNRVGATPLNHRVLVFRDLSRKLPAPTAEFFYGESRCPVCTGVADIVLGQPAFDKGELKAPAQNSLRLPTAVATDGRILAVADTDNNRVLIWNSIPNSNGAPADVVLGQPDFTKSAANNGQGFTPSERSLKGPQGVWIQGNRLFVADTGNNRILIWNNIPRQSNQPADLVLGQPDFRTFVQPDLTKTVIEAKSTTLLTPVSVTSDGIRLFVADLGHNRVLIWNSIPARNQTPADVVIGQPDMTMAVANNSEKLCAPTGKDEEEKDIFPFRCGATLDFPRYALSDGTRLFIADTGNDRVLIFNRVPTDSAASADVILGQLNTELNLISDSAHPLNTASASSVRSPQSLAWDGRDLYVSDPFNRRVMVFTMGEPRVPNTGVRNAASIDVYAVGSISFEGRVKEGDEVTIKIVDREYKHTIRKDETFTTLLNALANLINAGDGDPAVFASPNLDFKTILLTSRIGGEDGNAIEYSTATSSGAEIVLSTGGVRLAGGGDAAKIAPGTIVKIFGEGLSDFVESAPTGEAELPRELGGVQVYFDGIRSPLFSVSPTEVTAQVPLEVLDSNGVNAYVRTSKADGSVSVTTAIAVPVIPENPGIFAQPGTDPRSAIALHFSSSATGTVSVDGTAQPGDVATVTIEDRAYSYRVKEGDTLASIRDGLIEAINNDPKVEAFAAGKFTRIRLRARVRGPEGNGIVYGGSVVEGGQVILTPTTPKLCCANEAGAPVTADNPALPGSTIVVYATGLGLVRPDEARWHQLTGVAYNGPELNEPNEFVSSLAGGKTANVLFAGLRQGTVGLYEVHLELNSDLPTNSKTQLTIAQSFFVSNIVTIPVLNPAPVALPPGF